MNVAGVLILVFGGLAFLGKRRAYALFVLLSLAHLPDQLVCLPNCPTRKQKPRRSILQPSPLSRSPRRIGSWRSWL